MLRFHGRPSGRRRRFLRLLRAYERRLRQLEGAVEELTVRTSQPPIAPNGTKKLDGWKQIADFCSVSERTARDWAARAKDPLPVEGNGRRWAYAGAVVAWLRRNGVAVQVVA